MKIREWLTSCRKYREDVRKIRRGLIASSVFDAAPIWTRTWNLHLRWVWRIGLYQSRSSVSFVWHTFLAGYYRAADRVLGGTRFARYQDSQRQLARRFERKVGELKKRLQEQRERNFAREILYQAVTNPNFVVNDHIHQDR